MGSFLKGIAFGIAAGTASGLLFAPRSGNDTRRKLVAELDEATELTNEVTNSLTHFKQAVADMKQAAEATLPEFQRGVEKDLENFRFQAEPRIVQIQEQAAKIMNELPDIPVE